MRRKSLTAFLALWLAVSPALAQAPAALASRAEPDSPEAIVIAVGGVGGLDILGWSTQRAVGKAGLKYHVREFVWTHGWGQIFSDLQDRPHMEEKARDLARLIRRLQAEYPGRPVYLVAKSGGTGLAVRAAELLPEGSLERIVLLSAAMSPDYDLRAALRSCRREIVSYHSSFDQFILNWGTRQFGTIDRVYGPSAGLHGFRTPAELDEEGRTLYRRLIQVPWQPRMLMSLHNGGHAGNSFPAFLQAEVIPWLR
jgi:pimeloyl-ACP methyl ester carboxylesterase